MIVAGRTTDAPTQKRMQDAMKAQAGDGS